MDDIKILEFSNLFLIISGTVMGTVARIITLKVDTRQNPSYPNGIFSNIVIGFVASALGAVAIPALMARDFVAFTFLALAIQHFRDIRKLERESLDKLEKIEYSKRGHAYIDGIAKTYEARNYHALITSFFTVLVVKIFYTTNPYFNAVMAVAAGLVAALVLQRLIKGKRIGDICTLSEGRISVEGSDLYVDGMFVTNILGTPRSQQLFMEQGVGIVVTPKTQKFRLTIENFGQRQAMLFEATRSFGVKRFMFTRRNFQEGKLIIAFVPVIRHVGAIMEVIRDTPVLENSRKIHTIMIKPFAGGDDFG